MLQRLCHRANQPSIFGAFRGACRVCTCNCGRTIPRNEFETPQKRSYAGRPQTDPKVNARAGGAKLEQQGDKLTGDDSTRLYRAFMRRKLDGSLQGQPDQLLNFVERFADLTATKSPKSGSGVDVLAFKELIREIDVPINDARWCARWLVANTNVGLRGLGRKMMYTLSHTGDGWATLIIMEVALEETIIRSALLKSSELVLVRRHLTDMAAGKLPNAMERAEQLFMAKVCEGRVAFSLGNFEHAVSMWKAAMDEAVTYSEKHREKPGDLPALRANSAPWIDLCNAALARDQLDTAKWAADIGCQLDDPVSHYHAALLERRNRKRGQNVATGSWVYHMTKAAGSGHVQAIHALGVFYSTAQWKYFADDPPDYIKPTPFDSYPSSERAEQSFGRRVSAILGLKPAPLTDSSASVFSTAAFPNKAHDRWKLAMAWLETAMGLMYPPSFLVAAKLYMNQTLSRKAVAPESSLQLSDQRFEFASKADYEVGKKIQASTNSLENDSEPLSNPSFDPAKAKELIREVFYAAQAQAYRRNRLSQLTKDRSSKFKSLKSPSDINGTLSDEMLGSDVSPNIKKWFRFPELMQIYIAGERGPLYDDLTQVDVVIEARQMCNEMRWDLYDEDGGLLYKHE